MKRFQFEFQSLLKVRRYRRDQCRQLLALILSDRERLRAEKEAYRQQYDQALSEIRELNETGEVDIDRAASRRYHAGQLRIQLAQVEQRNNVVTQQLAAAQKALLLADQEVKSPEKLREKRLAAYRYELERIESRELEDAWTGTRALEWTA